MKTKPLRSTVELILTVAVALFFALTIQAFAVKPYRIPSESMVPTLEKGIIVEELQILRNLVITPEVQANGFGTFTEAKMKASLDFMVNNVGTGGDPVPRVQDLYSSGYLPKAAIKP